jgi:hypothetical protein
MPLVEISYRLEQVSRQWRLKLKSQLDFWVKENERTIAYVQSYRMENSFSNPVYVDDTLLASSDVNLLYVKQFLSSRLDKNVLGEMTLVIRIEIHWDRWKGY